MSASIKKSKFSAYHFSLALICQIKTSYFLAWFTPHSNARIENLRNYNRVIYGVLLATLEFALSLKDIFQTYRKSENVSNNCGKNAALENGFN